MGGDVAFYESAFSVKGELTGDEEEVTGADGLGVEAGGGRGGGGENGRLHRDG